MVICWLSSGAPGQLQVEVKIDVDQLSAGMDPLAPALSIQFECELGTLVSLGGWLRMSFAARLCRHCSSSCGTRPSSPHPSLLMLRDLIRLRLFG
jgi:hypothetical protein